MCLMSKVYLVDSCQYELMIVLSFLANLCVRQRNHLF